MFHVWGCWNPQKCSVLSLLIFKLTYFNGEGTWNTAKTPIICCLLCVRQSCWGQIFYTILGFYSDRYTELMNEQKEWFQLFTKTLLKSAKVVFQLNTQDIWLMFPFDTLKVQCNHQASDSSLLHYSSYTDVWNEPGACNMLDLSPARCFPVWARAVQGRSWGVQGLVSGVPLP